MEALIFYDDALRKQAHDPLNIHYLKELCGFSDAYAYSRLTLLESVIRKFATALQQLEMTKRKGERQPLAELFLDLSEEFSALLNRISY